MKFHSLQTDEVSLSGFGEEACAMLLRQDFAALANRFGYALAFDRDPAGAIEADFLDAVASPHRLEAGECQSTKVKYFAANSTGLFALVECVIPVADKAAILLELIVTGNDTKKSTSRWRTLAVHEPNRTINQIASTRALRPPIIIHFGPSFSATAILYLV